ncbi:MAG TPA: replicative DNA helicase [Metalysinibacillus jejuensis]|uniref:Replicative DNA helicase n=1 Tax=Metalysinibacillus jejuensis TaxID=914327 RepID=A0A921NBV5_9BACL|nr:replicative DNA helicase [Metalysinibacillus jejuensis]
MSDAMIERVPPHNKEAEQSIIGAVFLQPEALIVASERLQPQDFYQTAHQQIFEVMLELSDQGSPVDVVTVSEVFAARKSLEEIGGLSYLLELSNAVPTAANVEYYADIVSEKSVLRRLIRAATKIVDDGYMREDEVSELLSDAERSIMEVANKRNASDFKHIEGVLHETFDNIEKMHQNKGDVTGISTGYVDLDKMTAGFQRNDLIIVAARPSMGKTAFALNIAQNAAVRSKQNVAIFSLEMGAEQLVMRMLCAEGLIDAQRLRTGSLENEDWSKLMLAIGSLSKAGIYIDDSPGLRVNEIRAKCRRLYQESGLDMILIDYLQLIQGSGRPGENRQQEVSDISRSLKALARELKVPVIALSQLSRGVEQRQDKRPMMSDLRESGSIEQDADIVSFLYRDDYYNKEEDAPPNDLIEIILAKQRNGPTGTVKLAFNKQYNKFSNYTGEDVPNY